MRYSPSCTSLASFALLLFSAGLIAVEAKPESKPTTPVVPATGEKPTTAVASAQPDPTAAIVAEGKYVYRQRDLDALTLIAIRHGKTRLSQIEDQNLRDVLINALLAREPFLDALSTLPTGFSGPERSALILDLLDYQAELTKVPIVTNEAPVAEPTTTGSAGAAATATTVAAATAAIKPPEGGPMLIRLPALHLTRSLPGVGKRQLNLTIALFFRDPALAQQLQTRAPLVQDAILSHVQGLNAAQFTEPNQLTLKDGITAAIIAKIPEFPPDAVLIPEMDASAGDGVDHAKTKAAP